MIIDLDQDQIFYADSIHVEFSAQINGKMVTKNFDQTMKKDNFLFCRFYQYDGAIKMHLFNK